MKKILFIISIVFFINSSFAQILNPVKFTYTTVKKGKDTYELHIKTDLDPKWHIYSVKNPEGGADATSIKLTAGKVVGNIKEVGKMVTEYSKEFKVDQKYFERSVEFVQLVKLKPGSKKIEGTIEYMVCNDVRCLPPKQVEFKIKI
jgi:DsbC/DsbD-like thiol-disulfide interchange protein